MPVLRSRQTGDMYVQVVVETPQNLTKKQQELLAEFEKLSSGATQPEAAGFFTKVKDFFGTRAQLAWTRFWLDRAEIRRDAWPYHPIAALWRTCEDHRLDRFGSDLYLFMTIF